MMSMHRRWTLRQNSRNPLLYGHPNDDFIISMILIDAAKEICSPPDSFHNPNTCFVYYLELIDRRRHSFSAISNFIRECYKAD